MGSRREPVQFYYQLAGRRAPSRRFNENQQLVREGPNDYI